MIGVFGSNGFIGRHLVARLADDGIPVRAVSRRQDPRFTGRFADTVDFIEADLTDPLAMRSALEDIDTVVQLVSTSSPGLGNDLLVADIRDNVLPQIVFMQGCIRAGVRRYVFLSSGGTVYGRSSGIPFRETDHTAPLSSHGLTKVMVEKYLRMHGEVDGLDYAILRLANPYGPGQEFRKGQGLIPAVMDRCRRDLPVRIFGDGSSRRDYIHIDDVINAIVATLHLEGVPHVTLNIGSGTTLSVSEVVDEIEAVLERPILREYVPVRQTDVDISQLDIGLARRVLDWSPSIDFRSGLERTLRDGD